MLLTCASCPFLQESVASWVDHRSFCDTRVIYQEHQSCQGSGWCFNGKYCGRIDVQVLDRFPGSVFLGLVANPFHLIFDSALQCDVSRRFVTVESLD